MRNNHVVSKKGINKLVQVIKRCSGVTRTKLISRSIAVCFGGTVSVNCFTKKSLDLHDLFSVSLFTFQIKESDS